MRLTRAVKFYIFLVAIVAAYSFYLYDVTINKKKILKCTDAYITVFLKDKAYKIPREDISSLDLINGETVYGPERVRSNLRCDERPLVKEISIYNTAGKTSHFIKLLDPSNTVELRQKETHKKPPQDKYIQMPDGIKKFSAPGEGLTKDWTFIYYVLPENIGTDRNGNALSVRCYERHYGSTSDQRCSLQFIDNNEIFIDFDMLLRPNNFNLLEQVKAKIALIKSYETEEHLPPAYR